jgi:hypothetical protein
MKGDTTMIYRVHRHLESFLTFYYGHTKSGKIIVHEIRTKQLTGSKGGKAVKFVKKRHFHYDIDNYGIDTIF